MSFSKLPAESPTRHAPDWPRLDNELPLFAQPECQARSNPLAGFFHGWRVVLFCSWLNFFLILIPASWYVFHASETLRGLAFACEPFYLYRVSSNGLVSILALLPLVKLHELTTREMALRIGGSKTGLLNASMGNIVEVVVAFSALRKCELRVVHTSLIGAMLSKLLLVLGLCFFAGGIRFKEQTMDPTANQIHSSLLSISVGVLMLPAVYHFVLKDEHILSTDAQPHSLLKMSHWVSIILIILYILYIVFQFVSHPHLYKDNKHKHSSTLTRFQFISKIGSTGMKIGAGSPPLSSLRAAKHSDMFMQRSDSHPIPSQVQFASIREPSVSAVAIGYPSQLRDVPREETVKLVDNHCGLPLSHGNSSNLSGATLDGVEDTNVKIEQYRMDPDDASPAPLEPEPQRSSTAKEPRLSWFLITLLLVGVTVAVAFVADLIVECMDDISDSIRKEWIGLILLPAVTAIAECVTAVNISVRDQLTFTVGVAVGSTIQTALFVIPLMVIIGWIMEKPLTLLFDPFESLVLYIAVQTMCHVVADGKSNWLEGSILVGLYSIIAASFWFYPGTNLAINLGSCRGALLPTES